MTSIWGQSKNRWAMLSLVFGVGPVIFYPAFISPSMFRIANYKKRMEIQIAGAGPHSFLLLPASDQELKELEEVKKTQLARFKKIDSRESLFKFSGTLADALASQAKLHHLRVAGVELQNALVKGKYVPSNDRALLVLHELPSPHWDELADPLMLPLLKLPSVEVQVTVAGEYSQVFSFIESLVDFPVPVRLSGLWMVDDSAGRAFRLKIQGYYYGVGGCELTVQANATMASLSKGQAPVGF